MALEDSLLVLAGLLRGVALVLLVAAPHALGEVALVAEAGPRLEVLAALAPLDLKAGGGVDPNRDVARCADVLVLAGESDGLIVPAAHDAASLGFVGCGAGGGFLVAPLAFALPSVAAGEQRMRRT